MIIEGEIAKSCRFWIELLGNVLHFPVHAAHLNISVIFHIIWGVLLKTSLMIIWPEDCSCISTLTRRMSLCGKTRAHSVTKFMLCLFS